MRYSKAAQDVLLNVGFVQRLPGQIVRKRYIFVRYKTLNITAVSAQSLKQIGRNILPQTSCQKGALLQRCRVDLLARLRKACQPVAPGLTLIRKLPISKQTVRLRRLRRLGNFPLGLIQQVNHLLVSAVLDLLITIFVDKHQLQQVMRIAQAVQAMQILVTQQPIF